MNIIIWNYFSLSDTTQLIIQHTDMYLPHSNLFPIQQYPNLRALDVGADAVHGAGGDDRPHLCAFVEWVTCPGGTGGLRSEGMISWG